MAVKAVPVAVSATNGKRPTGGEPLWETLAAFLFQAPG